MKDFKTIEEQIALLQDRGLSVPEDQLESAKDFLLKNNYYRISGYSLTLRKADVFYNGVTISNLTDIYYFDREMRNLLLWAIEAIEVSIKSVYAYRFSESFGCVGHFDASNFTDANVHRAIIDKANDSAVKKLKHEAYLKHFMLALKEPVPLWAYVDLFTFSDISRLYEISKDDLKRTIANDFGITKNKAGTILSNCLHGLTVVRNFCAHDSRLYNRLFVNKASLSREEFRQLRKDEKGVADNSRLFGYILILRRLLSPKDFLTFSERLRAMCRQRPFVKMKYYGFPDGWERTINTP